MRQIASPATAIRGFKSAATNDTQSHVAFEIETVDGKSHPFWFSSQDIPAAVSFLLELGQFAAEQGGGLKPIAKKITTKPTKAIAVSAQPGRQPSEALLAVHVGIDQPVVFSMSTNGLAALRDALNKTVVTPTDGQKAN